MARLAAALQLLLALSPVVVSVNETNWCYVAGRLNQTSEMADVRIAKRCQTAYCRLVQLDHGYVNVDCDNDTVCNDTSQQKEQTMENRWWRVEAKPQSIWCCRNEEESTQGVTACNDPNSLPSPDLYGGRPGVKKEEEKAQVPSSTNTTMGRTSTENGTTPSPPFVNTTAVPTDNSTAEMEAETRTSTVEGRDQSVLTTRRPTVEQRTGTAASRSSSSSRGSRRRNNASSSSSSGRSTTEEADTDSSAQVESMFGIVWWAWLLMLIGLLVFMMTIFVCFAYWQNRRTVVWREKAEDETRLKEHFKVHVEQRGQQLEAMKGETATLSVAVAKIQGQLKEKETGTKEADDDNCQSPNDKSLSDDVGWWWEDSAEDSQQSQSGAVQASINKELPAGQVTNAMEPSQPERDADDK